MEWGTDPWKGRGKKREGKHTLDMRTCGLGEKGEIMGNMEMYEQKRRDRRERGKEIQRKSYC